MQHNFQNGENIFSKLLLRMIAMLLPVFSIAQSINSDSLFSASEEKIEMVDGFKLTGTLLSPKLQNKSIIAIIIAGSGPTDRNGNFPSGMNNSLKMLSESLFLMGIATLRYDKRGVGGSSSLVLDESKLRFEDYIKDAVTWIQHLKKTKKYEKIIIIGHSEGSLIGMVAAQKIQVEAFVSIAGAGHAANQIIKNQLISLPQSLRQESENILDSLYKNFKVYKISSQLYPIFRPSVQPYLMSWFRYDPVVEINKLKIPVCILQGTSDLQVNVNEADTLYNAKSGAVKYLIKDMNHVLKVVEKNQSDNILAYSDPKRPISKELIEKIAIFLKEYL